MDIGAITQLITSVGFPIVAYLLMYKQCNDMNSKFQDTTQTMMQALHENTVAIQRLSDKLENLEDK